MDCHSPGQGLMPASFKVRTVPLDGDDSATEDVLDPDFGEAAIGRVAPVDSGNLIILFFKIFFTNLIWFYKYFVISLTSFDIYFRTLVDYIVASIWKMFRRSFCSGEG